MMPGAGGPTGLGPTGGLPLQSGVGPRYGTMMPGQYNSGGGPANILVGGGPGVVRPTGVMSGGGGGGLRMPVSPGVAGSAPPPPNVSLTGPGMGVPPPSAGLSGGEVPGRNFTGGIWHKIGLVLFLMILVSTSVADP
jgi:hypothetical protein